MNPKLGRESKKELAHRTKGWRSRGAAECRAALRADNGEDFPIPTVHEALGLTHRFNPGLDRRSGIDGYCDNLFKETYWS
jgi:hypothetical protein